MDTNVIIDYLSQRLPHNGNLFIDNLEPKISVISRIELLGWYNANASQLANLVYFTSNSDILPLDENVIIKSIELRQQNRIKTPDAIIAATAIINGYILISNNVSDFKNISGLSLINPYNII